MSLVKIQGNASGTGILTIAAPNTNTDRTLTLPDNTGTFLTTGTAGVPVNGPAFGAYRNASQTISSLTWTKVQINTELFDTNSCFDSSTNYRFTPTVAGYYQINGSVGVNGGATETIAGIYKNGSAYLYGADATSAYISSVSTLIYLNGSTDYVELYGFLSGGTVIVGLLERTQFSGALVRAA